MHCALHHVGDISQALRTGWWATARDGLILTAANSRRHLAAWLDLQVEALDGCDVRADGPRLVPRYTLENGPDRFPAEARVERVNSRRGFASRPLRPRCDSMRRRSGTAG